MSGPEEPPALREQIAALGPDADPNAVFEKCDKDQSGLICRGEFEEVIDLQKWQERELAKSRAAEAKQRRVAQAYKYAAFAALVIAIAVIAALSGVTIGSIAAFKDQWAQKAQRDTTAMTNGAGQILGVREQLETVPLLAAPVLSKEELDNVRTITVTIEDDAKFEGEAKTTYRIAKTVRSSKTALYFQTSGGEKLFVFNGEAYLITTDGVRIELCEASVSCAAFQVDGGDAEALMEEAREALAAAGIESRARRLWGGGSWAHRLLNCYTAHELAAVRSRKTCEDVWKPALAAFHATMTMDIFGFPDYKYVDGTKYESGEAYAYAAMPYQKTDSENAWWIRDPPRGKGMKVDLSMPSCEGTRQVTILQGQDSYKEQDPRRLGGVDAVCQGLSDLFGIWHTIAWGCMTEHDYIRKEWTRRGCTTVPQYGFQIGWKSDRKHHQGPMPGCYRGGSSVQNPFPPYTAQWGSVPRQRFGTLLRLGEVDRIVLWDNLLQRSCV